MEVGTLGSSPPFLVVLENGIDAKVRSSMSGSGFFLPSI